MTTISLAIFGIGNVGSTLINQILAQKSIIKQKQGFDIKIPLVANSSHVFFSNEIDNTWELDFENFSQPYSFYDVFSYLKSKSYDNLIVVDATASTEFVKHYIQLIEIGSHIVAANKVANTLDYEFYKTLRKSLKENNKLFQYETNVGAGLPIVETVKNLYDSGENVQKIRGVFSGSLSYIFNRFSEENISFSEILKDASNKGYTEPDARDDLSGKDVARKLLILGRELGLKQNLSAVRVQSLVPKSLNGKTTLSQFKHRIKELDVIFEDNKSDKTSNEVLRYIGELDLAQNKLSVELVKEPKRSAMGQLQGADTLFEIYSESYIDSPLVIQGAGAGKDVTARGLFTDIIKIANTIR